jgi:hypothetical protein
VENLGRVIFHPVPAGNKSGIDAGISLILVAAVVAVLHYRVNAGVAGVLGADPVKRGHHGIDTIGTAVLNAAPSGGIDDGIEVGLKDNSVRTVEHKPEFKPRYRIGVIFHIDGNGGIEGCRVSYGVSDLHLEVVKLGCGRHWRRKHNYSQHRGKDKSLSEELGAEGHSFLLYHVWFCRFF